ncbi:hypothetical protein M404DRAFT_1004119 [Pisolithus tinctorius Marx 270]|uniref:Uncharacterized protein n=1 Tax=Pisolithus tinctorius Marx 270 TaxID=870435 RepID=A0A0C3NXZ1_PISTI|nr:hypothetical protein M404DRAFT_1004119 [Pisolithus tinctorius Marx 270]
MREHSHWFGNENDILIGTPEMANKLQRSEAAGRREVLRSGVFGTRKDLDLVCDRRSVMRGIIDRIPRKSLPSRFHSESKLSDTIPLLYCRVSNLYAQSRLKERIRMIRHAVAEDGPKGQGYRRWLRVPCR